jgi:ABC-2 type transport system permease protein
MMVAGAFLAVGAAISAMTKNQVIAFVLAVAACFFLTAAGSPVVTEFLTQRVPALAETARSISITDRLGGFTRGVISLRDVVFFLSFMAFFLFANTIAIDQRKAD